MEIKDGENLKSDRKKSPKVSPMAKTKEFEYCKRCNTLISWGTRCPKCGLTYEEDEAKDDLWTKSEAK